jgi:hypothetical protein
MRGTQESPAVEDAEIFGKGKKKKTSQHPPVTTSSLTHAHRCIGSSKPNWHTWPNSARLTYLRVYDSRDGASKPSPSPSPPSSLTHTHRYIGSHNPNCHRLAHTCPNSARLTYLSVYHIRDGTSEPAPSPSPPSSLTHEHNIQSHTLPTLTLLTFMWTQVLWCLTRLTRTRASGVTMTPDTRRTILSARTTQGMWRRVESSALVFSLWSHRQSWCWSYL